MTGLVMTDLTVRHYEADESYFEERRECSDVSLKCMVERVPSVNDMANGVFQSSQLKCKVHVSDPKRRVVRVGDEFTWNGNVYTVTGVDDGIMDENVVPYVPFRWTFTGEAKSGKS